MLIDLSHEIEHGMVTYKGLPAPHICDFGSARTPAANYDDGSTFQIGRIDMVANTGTYLDTPFHRYADGDDLAAVGARAAGGPRRPVRPRRGDGGRRRSCSKALDVAGKAVLVHTGWDRHWRTDAYQSDHPFLAEAAARLLAERGAALVGIDSYNIDDTRTRRRPVHTILLGAGTLDLRAYDEARRAPAERLPLHRRAAEDRRHGHLPGQGLRASPAG